MKGNFEVPEGFEIDAFTKYTRESAGSLFDVFAISDERKQVVMDAVNEGVKLARDNEKGETHTFEAMRYVSSKCISPNELVTAIFGVGMLVSRLTGGGPKVSIISIGVGNAQQEERDPIDDLIKQSYEINKKKDDLK